MLVTCLFYAIPVYMQQVTGFGGIKQIDCIFCSLYLIHLQCRQTQEYRSHYNIHGKRKEQVTVVVISKDVRYIMVAVNAVLLHVDVGQYHPKRRAFSSLSMSSSVSSASIMKTTKLLLNSHLCLISYLNQIINYYTHYTRGFLIVDS